MSTGLWARIFFGPNPVPPIDFLNRVLISHSFGECEYSAFLLAI
jgi:hypothetical protein